MRTSPSLSLTSSLAGHLRHSVVALGWEPIELPASLAGATASCWQSLAAHHREILVQRLVHDRSYDEIGRRMGIPTESVKYRINRARESLRYRMNETCPAFAAIAA
jgi:DNA-directed RNA polymerase specialized sigma24 family protein